MKNKRRAASVEILDNLDQKLAILLRQLESVESSKLTLAPTAKSWSVMQVLEHLYLAETKSWRGVQKRLKVNELSFRPMDWRTRIVEVSADYLLRLPYRRTAPKQVDPVQQIIGHSYNELISLWRKDRAELRIWLRQAPDHAFEQTCYGHPFFGWMSLVGMVYFFKGHFLRHQKQVFRTISKL